MSKYVRLLCFFIIILSSCTTRYLRSEFKTKSITGSTHEIRIMYMTFWGVSGLGIESGGDGFATVTGVYKDFPAHRGGIYKDDIILEINGYTTQGKSIEEVINMLRGEVDSYILLKVKRHMVGYGQIGGKFEKDSVLDFSYKRGISNGFECIQSPQTIIKGIICEFQQVERKEIKYFEKKNVLSEGGCFYGLVGGPSKFSEIGKTDTVYHNLGKLPHETFKISTKDNRISKNYKSDGEGIIEISLKDFCNAIPKGSDLVLTVIEVKNDVHLSNDLVVQNQYLDIVRRNENGVANLMKQTSALYAQGKYSKIISLYQQIKKEYPTTEIVLTNEINNLITETKNQKNVAALGKMKYKNIDFLLNNQFGNAEVLMVYLILNKDLKDEIRMIVVTDGLNIKVKDASEAWRIYNNLSSRQKLYGLLKLAEMVGGEEPLYKKLILKDWIYYGYLAEKLSYVKSSKLLTEP